ncbi:MAG: lipid-binding SYLF domain-containing protein [Proteobacteria bacterium]|nr:lipid-binding SYLF domain-containing protein [Pseudomonadota bacterium]
MTARRLIYAAALFIAANTVAIAGNREEARILEATQVLQDTQAMPDQSIPDWLLRRAQGIAVIPNVVKVALIAGGRGAKGVMVVRDAQGRWSNPVFLTLGGGSIGFQWGLQVSDVVLVFTTRRSIEGVTGGKLTLGADAAVAVGPVGRQVSGATDIGLAEVYSYSRSKGLFAGIAIDGTVLAIDHKANGEYYQRPGVLASELLSPAAPAAPASAQRLLDTLRRLPNGGDGVAPSGAARAPAAASGGAPAASQQAPADGRGLESGGATTYPLTDPPKSRG